MIKSRLAWVLYVKNGAFQTMRYECLFYIINLVIFLAYIALHRNIMVF